MEPLPTEIYQEIVDFQADVNRPIDISSYRDIRKDAASQLLKAFTIIKFFYLTINF